MKLFFCRPGMFLIFQAKFPGEQYPNYIIICRSLLSLGLGGEASGIRTGIKAFHIFIFIPFIFACPGHACCRSCSSFQILLFPSHISCQMLFLSRFEIAGWHFSSISRNPYISQSFCCSFRPLLPSPFLAGSWPCLLIKLPASRFCLFLIMFLAKLCFYCVSKYLSSFAGNP